jgi:peptidoglycan/xylan/chitin deacetylase (PgdA/CDA1 family)
LTITTAEFERQLKWLHIRGYKTLFGTEFALALHGGLDTTRSVLLTFDDGYLDNWYLAAPLLKKYGFKASIFVVTNKIHDKKMRTIGTWKEQDDDRYLSWDEVDAMVESGVFEVHSHTHSHTKFWLNETSGAETAREIIDDIATSLHILRSKYSNDIQLAWPWGYFRKEWLSEITKMGINVCYTMRPGTNYPGCDFQFVRRLGDNAFALDKQLLFEAATSPLMGYGLNLCATAWGRLRGRP